MIEIIQTNQVFRNIRPNSWKMAFLFLSSILFSLQPPWPSVPAPPMLQKCWSPTPHSLPCLTILPNLGPLPGRWPVLGDGPLQLTCCRLSRYSSGLLAPHPLGCHWPFGHSHDTLSLLCRSGKKYNLEDRHSQITVARDIVMLQVTQEIMICL